MTTDSPEVARCYVHNTDESFTPGVDYKACGECWHVWPTEDDFRVDVLNLYGQMGFPLADGVDLDSVYSCPLCAHDF